MNQGLKSNRKRGVILTSQGWEKLQKARQKAENQENFGVQYTFEELSDRTGLTPRTVARAFDGKKKVDKLTLEQVFRAFNLELIEGDYSNPQPNFKQLEQEISTIRQDWGEAVDVSVFYGRTEELTKLEQWILKERCRLVGLFGIGGIGKTSLSVKLAKQLQDKFEWVIWRSLRCAPPINKVLARLIQFVSNEQETEADLPEDLDSQILRLIDYLRASRCLLVLDNVETIMQNGDLAGRYRQGYEDYGELIRRIGEVDHQSCLVLASREKPQEFVILEGETLPIRSLHLQGLQELESREIFRAKGCFSGSDEEWKILIQRYAGNPLTLKIIATVIQELLQGDISEFLQQSPTVFGSIRHLLDQQFERLSNLETEVIYWLAINRENATLAKLREDILSPISKSKLLESLEGLGRRSLIEKCTKSFTLQTIVMEYVTNQLIEQTCQEIEEFATEGTDQIPKEKIFTLKLLKNHALIMPLGKDYVRDAQIRCILRPIAERLLTRFESKRNIQERLNQILATLRGKSQLGSGYAGGNIFNLLCQLQTDLSGYDFSHLTLWQADLRRVILHQVNLAHSDLSKSVFDEAIGSILSVAFSPNGKLLATGDFNNKLCLWRVADGKQLVTCQGHTGWVVSVAFSPDSRTLASGSADNSVKLWDIQGFCQKTWQEHTKAIQSVAFSPQGHILASGSDDQTIRLWDTKTGQCLKILQGHTQAVRAIAFSPQGHILASGSDDQTIRLWDTKTGQCLKILQGHTQPVRAIAYMLSTNSQGELLVSGGEDFLVRIWDTDTGQCLKILSGHTHSVLSIAFASSHIKINKAMPIHVFATSSHDKTIKLWDTNTGQSLHTLVGHTNSVRAVAFSPQSPILVSGGEDQALRVWDVSIGQCRKTLQGYTNPVWSIAHNPSGSLLASGNEDHTVKLWDVNAGKCCKVLQGHSSAVRSVAFSPDGATLASGSEDHTVKLWDLGTGRCRMTLSGDDDRVWSIAFSPDGSTLASGHENHIVKLWDSKTGQWLATFTGHHRDATSIAFSPDGHTLASASRDHTVRLWNSKTGECLNVLQGHSDVVWGLTCSPDGRKLASASRDHTVKLWNVTTGECLQTLAGHRNWLWCSAFSPDSRTLASGGNDWVVKLWDVSTGQELKTLQGHTECIRAITFSPDSKILSTSSDDETIRLWDFLTGECLLILRSERAYEGMNIAGTIGLTEATINTLLALGAVEQ